VPVAAALAHCSAFDGSRYAYKFCAVGCNKTYGTLNRYLCGQSSHVGNRSRLSLVKVDMRGVEIGLTNFQRVTTEYPVAWSEMDAG